MSVGDGRRSLLSERLGAFERLAAEGAGGDGNVEHVLRLLADLIRGDVALLDPAGAVVASAPGDASWTENAELHPGTRERVGVFVGDRLVGTLLLRADELDVAIPRFAATVLAGDLTQRTSALSARRQLAEQILEDVLAAVLPEDVAARRLLPFGIRMDKANQVLVGRFGGKGPRAPTSFGATVVSLLDRESRPELRAVLGGEVVVALASGATTMKAATALHAELQRGGGPATVAIGGAYRGVGGIRMSYSEAHSAAAAGSGVVIAEPLSITDYMRIEKFDPAVVEQGAYVLAPLTEHDTRGTGGSTMAGDLVHTLAVFLTADCNHAQAARQLHLHPNTVRYRLRQIEAITGHDLSSFLVRTHFFLALATARRLAVPG